MAFSFPNERLESRRVTRLMDYLDLLGFNSFRTYPEKFQKKNEPLKVDPSHPSEAFFMKNYQGVLFSVAGKSAQKFYQLSHHQSIDWAFFSTAHLTRFDLAYDRAVLPEDTPPPEEFLVQCKLRIPQPYQKNTCLFTKKNSSTLTIGSRRSDNYF